MPLEPLKQWVCDRCGVLIEGAEEGWLEWYRDRGTREVTGFRIVHHLPQCQYNEDTREWDNRTLLDNHLQYFLGYDGFAQLLSMFDYEKFADPKELTEIIRRLHLPYFEEARQYWSDAANDGLIHGNRDSDRDYFQDILITIIERYSE